ncbi:MAG: DUF5908 family protein [Bacteroidia bacterium]|nr:DUF5908 family protein [Bacteroidia bacterium]
MPIEIRELIIRATVSESPQQTGATSTSSAAQGESMRAEAIAAQVAELLRKRKER